MSKLPVLSFTQATCANGQLSRQTLVWWLAMLFMAVIPVTGWTQAGLQLIQATAYWEDNAARASLTEAQQQKYTPYEGIFNRGYSTSAHWLRLRLGATEHPVALRLSPPWIDEITLYDPLLHGKTLRAGDRHPEGSNTPPALGYSIVLPASPQPRDLWLRLQSTSTQRLSIEALPLDELAAAETRMLAWTAIYAAILLLMLLALLSVWWVQRERVLGVYLVRHCVYMVYGLSYLGLPSLLLPEGATPPGFMDSTFSLFVASTLPVGLWFDITLLSGYRPHVRLVQLLKLIAWSSLILPLMVLAGRSGMALQTTVQGLMLAALLVFVSALTCRPDTSIERLMPKKIMLGYYTLILGSLVIGLSALLGLFPPQAWSHYLLILHGLVSGLVMTVILFVRGQRQYRLNQQMSWQLQKTQQDMEFEQRRRHEQSQFLHMLMHELKTPLSIVSLALGTQNNREENLQYASRAVQDMKAIIDRCVETDRMGDVSLRRHNEAVDLLSLVNHIAQNIPQLPARVQVQAPTDLPQAHTDRQLLQIVLTNLLDNANRYSDPLTPVSVQLQVSEQHGQPGLTVIVANTPGLAGWPDMTKLFTKYYRASGAQRESGSGLGLYLSRELARSLGGNLDYRPREKQVGFELWIPLKFA